MSELLSILGWGLAAVAGAGALYWFVILLRVVRARITVPSVRTGLGFPLAQSTCPRISIIVPAHNEQEVIGRCVRRLLEQTYSDLEIVVVLDRCTDETRQAVEDVAANDPRMRVVENQSCPPDWAGKCNAARVGVEHATGEWLLFTDADTQFDPDLVRAAIGLAMDRHLGMLSLLSTLTIAHRFERVIQPVASLNLMRMFPIDRVNRPGSRRCFANGQFMLFARATYERIGGHAIVKDDLLEDISFARHVTRQGEQGGLFFDGGMLVCSMYESLEAFCAGWKRIFIESCKRRPDRLRKHARRTVALALGEPLVHLLALGAAGWAGFSGNSIMATTLIGVVVVGVVLKYTGLMWIYRIAGAPISGVLKYELGAWHVARIMAEGADDLDNRRPIRWGGREYVLEPQVGAREKKVSG